MTAAIAAEACSATPRTVRTVKEANVRVAPTRLSRESVTIPTLRGSDDEKREPKPQAPEVYQWGKDFDQDQKRIAELSEIIAAFSVNRYAECLQDAFEKETEANSDVDSTNNCSLTVEDDDTKEILTEDIPGNIQRDILGKVHALLDDFKAREEAQRAKTREAFEKLKDAINNTLAP